MIFDLDGVIADSEPLSAKADDIVLAKHGIHKTQKEKEQSFGRRGEEIYGDLLRVRKLDIPVTAIIKEKTQVFESLIKGSLKPIRHSLELIGYLKSNGFRVALATSSHIEKALPELKELGIEGAFEVTVTGEEVKKGKPDPEIFLKTAQKLGVKPSECAVIEDSAFGVTAAKHAGMFTIGFRSPNSRGQDLSRADLAVSDLSEAIAHFRKEARVNLFFFGPQAQGAP